MSFTEYKGMNLPKVAEEVLKYWEENDIFEKSVSEREGNEPLCFLKARLPQTDYPEFTT